MLGLQLLSIRSLQVFFLVLRVHGNVIVVWVRVVMWTGWFLLLCAGHICQITQRGTQSALKRYLKVQLKHKATLKHQTEQYSVPVYREVGV